MAKQFPKTAEIETFVKGMRLVDNEFDFYEVTYVSVRGYVGLGRADGHSMGAGSWVSFGFAKLKYKHVLEA
jgi:hypothetical protein